MSSAQHSKNLSSVTPTTLRTLQFPQGRPNLMINTISNPYCLMNGLQGSGKFTDNVFRSSLRKEMVSPKSLQKSFLNRTSNGTPVTIDSLSARSLKSDLLSPVIPRNLLGANKTKPTTLKTKENDPLRLKKNIKQTIKKKPKYNNYQGNVLRESNREVTEPGCQAGNKAYNQYKGSFLTEQDSSFTDFECPSMDINQQLRTIFNAGMEEIEEDSAMDFSIAEEQIQVERLIYKVSNVMKGK